MYDMDYETEHSSDKSLDDTEMVGLFDTPEDRLDKLDKL